MKVNRELLSGSLILLITFNMFNLLNFLFQFSMARMLDIVQYGVLATLFSIIYIFGVFSESIETVLTKYSSPENNKGKLKNILKKSFRKALSISFILFIFYLIILIFASKILNISYSLLAINGLFIFIVFLLPVTRGIMQGRHRFASLGKNYILEGLIKLLFALSFVYLGFQVYGAIVASILGAAIALIFSVFSLRDITGANEKSSKTSKIYAYTAPVFLITLVVTIFYSLDIIIAKIVFSAEVAGFYALASILSKTIFAGTQSISKAMFPFSADYKKGKKFASNAYLNSLALMLFLLFICFIVFYFFPNLLIRIFSGRYIPQSSKILFYLAVASGIISFANLNLMYNLSIGKTKGALLFILFIFLEIILLFVFSQTLVSFSIALIVSALIFLIGSIFILRK